MQTPSLSQGPVVRAVRLFSFLPFVLLAGCSTGPGSGGSVLTGNTQTTLLISSTNNSQIPIMNFNLQSVALVNSAGTSVPLLSSPVLVEVASLNAIAHTLGSISVPQGAYTSVKLTYGFSNFVVIDHSDGSGIDIGEYNIGSGTPATITVSLATPLQVTGTAMGVLLNLDIPHSVTYSPYFAGSPTRAPNGGATTFTPSISVSPVTIAAQPSSMLTGKIDDLHGQVTATGANSLTITTESGLNLALNTSTATVFAGPAGSAAPAAGSFVDVNASLQPDGSTLATSVQTEASGVAYNMVGQILQYSLQTYVENTGREQQGPNLPNGTGFFGANNVQFNGASQFQIAWPGGTAPSNLPFTPTVTPASISPGQNVATPVAALQTVGNIIPVTPTLTLEPQTIDATISSVSTVNGQTTYQLSLFPNDFIALFTSSTSVTVYTTAQTQTVSNPSLQAGSIVRVRGLLFNNAGTLSMIASGIQPGVPAT